VDDIVTGRGRHRVVVRWHLAPGVQLELAPAGAQVRDGDGRLTATVTVASAAGSPALAAATAEVSAGFGRTRTGPVLTCSLTSPLPVRISTVWRRAEPLQETL
jgi:hypothetical protein